MLEQIVIYIITTILGMALGYVTSKFKKNKKLEEEKEKEEKKKINVLEMGVQALLRNEIIRRYREFESKGEISILDKENLEEMFEQYKNLGGNGTVKKMMDELLNLKTKIIK